jgi:glycosyltransferase involved in cell wall biosynthesis
VPPLVAIDARDAVAPQLRGWGRYAACLLDALQAAPSGDFRIAALTSGGVGPEVVFEQLVLPVKLHRLEAALIHVTNCFLPLARPCPGVVTIHDLAFETWPEDFAPRTRLKYRFFARAAARSAQRVICPSEHTAADVCERYGVSRERVRVIPEAPALERGDEPAPAGRYILAIGDLRRKKNLAALVRAFVTLRRRDQVPHRLVLGGVDAGEGPRLAELAQGEPVELTGYLTDARLDALLRGAELLVHPSLYEGFGLVLLEAMARGTPVLAARATALPEVAGDAAAFFDPSDPVSLEAELSALLRDESRRAVLARRGQDRAQTFSWERTARETAMVYLELL